MNGKNRRAGRTDVLKMKAAIDAAMSFSVAFVHAMGDVPIRRVKIVREAHPFDFDARYVAA